MYVHQIQRPALYLIISVCSIFYNSLAQATSFNCLSPNLKKFEQMICFNKTLSLLDERVNSYYEDALKVSPNPEEVKKFQKIDMARRKTCETSNCLQTIYEATLVHLKDSMKKHVPIDSNKPAYPVWISPLLTDPELKTACADWKSSDTELRSDDIACKALNIMNNAKPANQSAVNDFVFTENSVDILPDLLRLGGDGRSTQRCKRYLLNLSRTPITQSQDYLMESYGKIIHEKQKEIKSKIKSTVIDKNQLLLTFDPANNFSGTEFYTLNIKILGKGDFLGTGWESLLLQVLKTTGTPSSDSSFRDATLFILSRKSPSGVFQVANPEQYLETRSGDGSVTCTSLPMAP
jgi:uncharacterized protein